MHYMWSRSQVLLIIMLTLAIFSVFAGYAIEERGGLSRMWVSITSFLGGLTAGGLIGMIVGGIGIAAMGTAFGLPAFAVAGFGALFGGVLAGSIGTSIFAYFADPSRYELNQLLLAGILLASLAAAAITVLGLKRFFA